jgi:hypothetical protein
MDLLEIPKNPDKEVFTVKHNGSYYAVVTGDDVLYVSPEVFDSPLKASNHARSIKRQHKIDVKIKKEQKSKVLNNTAKIPRKNKLYTEAEMASETKLKFREVWIILDPWGRYAKNIIKNKTVVEYSSDKESAQRFGSYEEAVLQLKTLDMVVKRGHKLQRFFERKD